MVTKLQILSKYKSLNWKIKFSPRKYDVYSSVTTLCYPKENVTKNKKGNTERKRYFKPRSHPLSY